MKTKILIMAGCIVCSTALDAQTTLTLSQGYPYVQGYFQNDKTHSFRAGVERDEMDPDYAQLILPLEGIDSSSIRNRVYTLVQTDPVEPLFKGHSKAEIIYRLYVGESFTQSADKDGGGTQQSVQVISIEHLLNNHPSYDSGRLHDQLSVQHADTADKKWPSIITMLRRWINLWTTETNATPMILVLHEY